MNLFNILLLVPIYHLFIISASTIEEDAEFLSKVTYLEPGETIFVAPEKRRIGFYSTELRIFCYRGNSKSLTRLFQTVKLHLDIDNDEYMQYEGTTPHMVREHYDKQTSIFHYFLSNKKTDLKLNPFNQTCIGIDTMAEYRVKLYLKRIDFWKIVCLIVGLLIFLNAGILSHNSLFYYLSGILLGIFASLLIVVYFSSKLLPQRPMMYGVLLCGWSLAFYLFQMLWDNIQVILVTYQTYVFWYVLLTGFISFVICYRFGPPENQRSKDLIKWGLQLLALVAIFYSSEFQEASAAIVIITIFLYYFPRSWLHKFKHFYIRRFPPKPRLLTNEEYYEQGVRETTKALDDLRKYANSPECKQWQIVSKLKDPLRFATFVEGTSHISDQEILEYETSRADISDSELSEDDDNNDGSHGSGRCNDGSDRQRTPLRVVEQLELEDDISEDEEEIDAADSNNYSNRNSIRISKLGTRNGTTTETTLNRRFHSSYNQAPMITSRTFRRSDYSS